MHFRGHGGSGERHGWRLQSIIRSLCPQSFSAASTSINKLILPHIMASCFIHYVPKPTNEKHSSKPPCKNVPKQPSTQIERNSVPIRASAVDSDLLMQKVNGDDGIMAGCMRI